MKIDLEQQVVEVDSKAFQKLLHSFPPSGLFVLFGPSSIVCGSSSYYY